MIDTDDIGRVWRAVFAALCALGLRVRRVDSCDRISVARGAGENRVELKVAVIPLGDAQLVVRVEPVIEFSAAEAPVLSESFFNRLSRELYLTAHRV